MARSQFRSNRRVSGKKYNDIRKARAMDMAGIPAFTAIGKERLKIKRVRGGNSKKQLLSAQSVFVTVNGKVEKYEISTVEVNPANINFTRRNVITKGTIVKTNKGSVKITSRPGQTGTLFGVLVE